MGEPTRQKFLWFLDHYLQIKGYEYRENVHVPVTLKPIDVPIDDTPLSKDIKLALKNNGFTNISEVAKLSERQIHSLPKVKTTMVSQIIRYFIIYQPNNSPDDYYMLRYH